jgi:hypothetical protein
VPHENANDAAGAKDFEARCEQSKAPLIRVWSPTRLPAEGEFPAFYSLSDEQAIMGRIAEHIDEIQAWAAANGVTQIDFMPYRKTLDYMRAPGKDTLWANCYIEYDRNKLPDHVDILDPIWEITQGVEASLFSRPKRFGNAEGLAKQIDHTLLMQRGAGASLGEKDWPYTL